MRSQLLVSGLLVMLLGAVFYVLQIPLAFSWSLVFVLGGGIMAIASFVVQEGAGPVQPPEGYHFCRFCSALVQSGAGRCPQCNGLQATEVR
jgi:hypothetical protein